MRRWILAGLGLALATQAPAQVRRGDFEKAVPAPPPAAVPDPQASASPPSASPPSASPPPAPPPAAPPPPAQAAPSRPAAPGVTIWPPAAPGRAERVRPNPGTEARAAAEAFHRAVRELRLRGLPDATQRGRLRAQISPALDAALAAAFRAEQQHRQTGRGALQEGDVFTALAAPAEVAGVEGCDVQAERATCRVRLRGADPVGGEAVQWTDQLVLLRLFGGWRVDDVIYGGRFALGNHGRLTDLLSVLERNVFPRPAPGAAGPAPQVQPSLGQPPPARSPAAAPPSAAAPADDNLDDVPDPPPPPAEHISPEGGGG